MASHIVLFFFIALMTLGNVVLLNLLISIIGDQYDRFTEMATLKGVQSRAEACVEAECQRPLLKLESRLFPRYLQVLRADSSKAGEGKDDSSDDDEYEDHWEGKVQAVTRSMNRQFVRMNHVVSKIELKVEHLSQGQASAMSMRQSKMDALGADMRRLELNMGRDMGALTRELRRLSAGMHVDQDQGREPVEGKTKSTSNDG